MDYQWLSWLCIIGIFAIGVANLFHVKSTVIMHKSVMEENKTATVNRYQTASGILDIAVAAVALAGELLVKDARAYFYVMLGAVVLLFVGSIACSKLILKKDA